MSKLINKVTVITGGNSGIGFGIAEAFKNEGAVGVITGRNEASLANYVNAMGENFISVKTDVTSLDDLEDILKKTADKFGKIDVLVVNAGGVVDGVSMRAINEATEKSYMDLNLKSAYFTVQKSLPYLNDGASVILIGSSAAHRAAPGMAIYGTAKATIISLAKGLFFGYIAEKNTSKRLFPRFDRYPRFWENSTPGTFGTGKTTLGRYYTYRETGPSC
ncbi:hypothetical protein GCM10027051_22160 [Niabella terrae]